MQTPTCKPPHSTPPCDAQVPGASCSPSPSPTSSQRPGPASWWTGTAGSVCWPLWAALPSGSRPPTRGCTSSPLPSSSPSCRPAGRRSPSLRAASTLMSSRSACAVLPPHAPQPAPRCRGSCCDVQQCTSFDSLGMSRCMASDLLYDTFLAVRHAKGKIDVQGTSLHRHRELSWHSLQQADNLCESDMSNVLTCCPDQLLWYIDCKHCIIMLSGHR